MSKKKAKIVIQNLGIIEVELFSDTPETTNQFVELAKQGFYNGLVFHKIVPNFIAQSGCPDGTGLAGSGNKVLGEFKENGIDNEHKHNFGAIALARTADYNSGDSQFYLALTDLPQLDGKYAVFGNTIAGHKVLKAMNKLGSETGKPTGIVTIQKIEIEEN